MSIPFIDLKSQYIDNKESIDRAIQRVLDHGQYIMGPEVELLEKKLAEYLGVKHAIACSSGTDALVLPLMTKNLSPRNAVFTSTFTFFASAEAISLAGGTPVFVDIDPHTYNIDPKGLEQQIEKVISEGELTPSGILPVDLFGLAANYEEILPIAEKYNLFVLEDAAQSFGARYQNQKAGAFGDVAATSFYPAKPLGCYGDGGAIFTNNTSMYEEMLSLRVHGQALSGDKYDNVRIGLNARMDTIQAAILLEKLKTYDIELERRNAIAEQYSRYLGNKIQTPRVPVDQVSVWAQYSIEVSNRDSVRAALLKSGIPTAVFYPIPVHLSKAYSHLGYKVGDFPVAEKAAGQILSLPMHPFLKDDQVLEISERVRDIAK